MKNIFRKSICSVMTAVTLSACVVVPSALNQKDSKIAVVTSMDAEAAFEPFYAIVTVTGSSLRDQPNGRTIARLWAFTPMYVSELKTSGRNYWYKVSTPEGEGWVNGRDVVKSTADEYVFRSKFYRGERYVFVMERKGIDVREKANMNSKSIGYLGFMRTAEIDSLEIADRDGIIWAHLANGRGYIPLNDGKGRMHCDLMTKEQAARIRELYF